MNWIKFVSDREYIWRIIYVFNIALLNLSRKALYCSWNNMLGSERMKERIIFI